MQINTAITVQERYKIYFAESCSFANFPIFRLNTPMLPDIFQRKSAPLRPTTFQVSLSKLQSLNKNPTPTMSQLSLLPLNFM